jgi:sugar/nucleoside kinase (ribokinase family)
MEPVDYLLIGHVCRDLTPDGPRLGGTVSFGALMAQALGQRVGIVTSAPDTLAPLLALLESVPLQRVPAPEATTFENVYTPAGREQTLRGRAARLTAADIPEAWQHTRIAHLAPVADEVDPRLAAAFPGAFVGVTPQGWMRAWDEAGRVTYRAWPEPESVLRHADALALSIEDVGGDEAAVRALADMARVVAVTRSHEGATLYVDGSAQHIPAPRVRSGDETGAGDIFAVAFFIHLSRTGDPLAAAHFATTLASDSVRRAGIDSIPDPVTIRAAEAAAGG